MPAAHPGPSSITQDLAQALSRVERRVVGRLEQALEADCCTIEQWRALVLLSDGKGHSMSDIAKFALVPAPSLTRVVDRLTTDGLVYRTVDPRDRRRVLVHITTRGQALYRRLADRIERQQGDMLGTSENAEARRLLGLLSALLERLH
jgi:DNA-binding MarR family transcriptional regulator